jgi:hypothetical protein
LSKWYSQMYKFMTLILCSANIPQSNLDIVTQTNFDMEL